MTMEIVKTPTAAEQLAEKRKAEKDAIEQQFEAMQAYDWEKLPPPLTAKLLTYKEWRGDGDVAYHMSFPEALMVAIRCNKLGVDPFSDEVYYMAAQHRLALTLEGEIAAAKKSGFQFGVPKFEYITRPWPAQAAKIQGYTEDRGCTCTMQVKTAFGDGEIQSTAWVSEWYMPRNPNWVKRTDWMLGVRAQSNAIKQASGVGVSANISDQEIATPEVKQLDAKDFVTKENK